jgi:hypothetical protein
MNKEITLTKGSKLSRIGTLNGRFTVYVGHQTKDSTPGEETVPARWFKGFSTCSADYATEKAARKAAEKFLTA